MAKNRAQIPEIDDAMEQPQAEADECEQAPAGSVTVRLTISPPEAEAYCERRPELNLTSAEARTLAGIQSALMAKGSRLSDGRTVGDAATAVRWILQQAGK
jgi:hypothetical protein